MRCSPAGAAPARPWPPRCSRASFGSISIASILSSVVSKYIGETEKNLKKVFDAAEEGGVLLLFDEADALFGKRSEVRDSHDRYANIEVGYLLQRMEAYQGLAILTTNLRSPLDPSFQRRLRFTINFPFPDAAQREAIWRSAFPQATPTRALDHKKLAQLNVTGGNIRNIALNAAFLAAQAGTTGGDGQSARCRQAGGAEDRASTVGCGNAGMGMRRIRLNIDRLVLNGFDPHEGKALAGALESQLQQVLADPATRNEWAQLASHAGREARAHAAARRPCGRKQIWQANGQGCRDEV